MPKIPLYQQNIQLNNQPVSELRDPNEAAPIYNAIRKLADTAVGLGEKFDQEKQKSEMVGYIVDREERFEAFKKTAASIQDPDELQEFYQKWSESESKIFQDTRISRGVRRELENNNALFYGDANKVINGANGLHRKLEIATMAKPYYKAMVMAENGQSYTDKETDTVMEPEAAHAWAVDNLVSLGVMDYGKGLEAKTGFASTRDYKLMDNTVAHLTELYKSGEMTPTGYVDELSNVRKSIKETKMSKDKGLLMDTMITYKIANAKQLSGRKGASEVSRAIDDISNGNFDMGNVARLERNAGDALPEAVRGAAISNLKGAVAADGDAKWINDDLIRVRNGSLSVDKYLANLEKTDGQTRTIATVAAMKYVTELAKEDGIATYDVFWGKNKKFKINDGYDGFFDALSKQINLTPEDNRNEFYNGAMKALEKFQKSNPEATTEQREQFTKEVLEGNAKEIVNNILISGTWITGYETKRSPAYQRIIDAEIKAPVVDKNTPPPTLAPDGKWYTEIDGKYYEVVE